MKAYSTASGGVIFVPEDIERETKSVSYKSFVKQEDATEKVGVFGKKSVNKDSAEAHVA